MRITPQLNSLMGLSPIEPIGLRCVQTPPSRHALRSPTRSPTSHPRFVRAPRALVDTLPKFALYEQRTYLVQGFFGQVIFAGGIPPENGPCAQRPSPDARAHPASSAPCA